MYLPKLRETSVQCESGSLSQQSVAMFVEYAGKASKSVVMFLKLIFS